jgi:hypothetical protein
MGRECTSCRLDELHEVAWLKRQPERWIHLLQERLVRPPSFANHRIEHTSRHEGTSHGWPLLSQELLQACTT